MCDCRLVDGYHWWVDLSIAKEIYQVAETPEQAEVYLRIWAAKTLSVGHQFLDIRTLAARVLATHVLNMVSICSNKTAHDKLFGSEIGITAFVI